MRTPIGASGIMKSKVLCVIANTDFAEFDWLVLSWVLKVFVRVGIDQHIVRRVQNLYQESITIVVNNQLVECCWIRADP